MTCGRNGPGSLWATDASIRSWGARGAIFPFPSRVVCLVDDEALVKLLHDLSFDLVQALLAFTLFLREAFFVVILSWFVPVFCLKKLQLNKLKVLQGSSKNEERLGNSCRRILFRKVLLPGCIFVSAIVTLSWRWHVIVVRIRRLTRVIRLCPLLLPTTWSMLTAKLIEISLT